jgi:hypothetical protein
LLTAFDILSRDRGNIYLNLIICVEIVLAAVAQAYAFTYQDYIVDKEGAQHYYPVSAENRQNKFLTNRCSPLNSRQGHGMNEERSVIKTIGQLALAPKELLDDAHSTFIKDRDETTDQEMQMDELTRGKNAFNWSDEETVNAMDESSRKKLTYKQKYSKKQSAAQSANSYYESLKSVV